MKALFYRLFFLLSLDDCFLMDWKFLRQLRFSKTSSYFLSAY